MSRCDGAAGHVSGKGWRQGPGRAVVVVVEMVGVEVVAVAVVGNGGGSW